MRSEEKYRLLIEGVKDYAIFMLSPEGNILTWNDGAKRLKGYSEEEIIGKHFSVFYSKSDLDSKLPDRALEQALKLGMFEHEGLRVKKDGTTFFASVFIRPMFNEKNDFIGYSKITRDLTERKAADEKLRKSEEKYRLLVEGVKDYSIFMISRDGYIQSWNEGAKRMKGYSESEVLGKHFSIFYPNELVGQAYPEYELQAALKEGRFEDEGLRIRKDGSSFFANVVISTIYNSQGDHVGFSKITKDLTEIKVAEKKLSDLNTSLESIVKARTEELSASVKELKLINSELDNFIYTASHDLKAPVMNIEGLVTTLKDSLIENKFINEEVDALLQMIDTSLNRFQKTIMDLSSISEIQKINRDDKVEINLSELIEDIKGSIPHLIKESNANFIIDAENLTGFRFTSIHVRSIIYNLMTNAIKYRSPDRALVIKIKSYTTVSSWVIEVTDNGLGIKEENTSKVFQMFKRLHTHVEGSGIGLYIVKRIVDNAGGSIELTSKPDQGTTFKISLPR